MSAGEDDDETQVAAMHPLRPVDPRSAYVPYGDDHIPDEDETLVALDRRAVPFDPRAMGRALPAIPTPPRPAAGMPAAMPPPRPAAGMPATLPPPAMPPPRPAAMPMPTPAPEGFQSVARTLTLPQADPRVTSPLPAAQAPYPGPPGALPASQPATQPPPASQGHIELAPEGMPPLVVRFLLVCGLLTVLGLLALIYLQL
jgi:hypothetical protein